MRVIMVGMLAVVLAGVAWATSAQGAVDYVQFDAQQLVSSPQSAWARPILFTDELDTPVGSPDRKLDRKKYAELRLKTVGSVWVPEADLESFAGLEVGKTYSFGGTVDQFRGKYYVIVDTSFPIQTKEALEEQWSGRIEGGTAEADDPVVQNLLVEAQNRLIQMAQEQGVTVEQLIEAQTDGGQRIAETIVAESLQSQLRESNQTAEQVMIDAVVALLQKEATLKGSVQEDESLPAEDVLDELESEGELLVDVPDEDVPADGNWWAGLEESIAELPDTAPAPAPDVPVLPDVDLPEDGAADVDVADADVSDEPGMDVVAMDGDVGDGEVLEGDLADSGLSEPDLLPAGDTEGQGDAYADIPDEPLADGDVVAMSGDKMGMEDTTLVAMPIPGLVQPMDGSAKLTPMVSANPTAAELEESARLQRQLAAEQEAEAKRLEKEAREEAKRQEKARKEAEAEARRLEKEARRAEEEAREREEEARIAAEKEAERKLKQAKREAEEQAKALKAALEAQQEAAVEAARQGDRLAAAKEQLERQRQENEEAMKALEERRKAAEAAKAAAENAKSTVQADVEKVLEEQLAVLQADWSAEETELNEQLRQALEITQEEQARQAQASADVEAEKSAVAEAKARLEEERQATAAALREAEQAEKEAQRAEEDALRAAQDAQEELERARKDAERAKAQAEKKVAKARAEAESARAKAEEEAEALRAKAEADAEKAKAKADALREAAKADAAAARAKAEAEKEALKAEAEAAAEKARREAAAKKAAEEKKAAEAKKAADEKKAADAKKAADEKKAADAKKSSGGSSDLYAPVMW